MRKQVLFVQGGGRDAHEEDAKLAASLAAEIGPDYEVHYPVMPDEASPDYAAWKQALAKQLASMGDGAILVGHSVGATITIMFLTEGEPKPTLAGVFLISAPFVGAEGWRSEDFELPKNIGAKLPKGAPIYLYHGREDEIVPVAHVDLYAKAIPQAFVCRLNGRNHQLNDDLAEVARDIKRLG